MAKRMIIVAGALLVVIGAIGLFKYQQIRAAIEQGASFQMPPEPVTTVVAAQDAWQGSLNAIGSVAAVRGVIVSADLPGVITDVSIPSGQSVRAGTVLVRQDTEQERAQLAAAEAQRDLSRLNLDRAKDLHGKEVISQAEYDRAEAEAKGAAATAAEVAAVIERKTIRAPFAGILGIRRVNLGQYLAGGDPIVPLQALDPIYVNFSLPQQNVSDLHKGAEVHVHADGIPGLAGGKITAVNSIVDASTRNVEIQATFTNKGGVLRPGMFVEVQVMLPGTQEVIALPSSAINFAPYGNSVYIVEDMDGPDGQKYKGVRQQFVKLGGSRGDQVAVLSGVKPGEEIVSSGVFKLRPGAAVVVNNDVKPGNESDPHPTDS